MRQAANQMHLSRSDSDCRGALKIAVIVNEVGSIDVDSLLVNLKQVPGTFCMRDWRLPCITVPLKHASHRPLCNQPPLRATQPSACLQRTCPAAASAAPSRVRSMKLWPPYAPLTLAQTTW